MSCHSDPPFNTVKLKTSAPPIFSGKRGVLREGHTRNVTQRQLRIHNLPSDERGFLKTPTRAKRKRPDARHPVWMQNHWRRDAKVVATSITSEAQMPLQLDEVIADRSRLRELLPEYDGPFIFKVANRVTDLARRYIAATPFILVATIGKDGRIDVSPKGDSPGFVEVFDDNTLIIPDRLIIIASTVLKICFLILRLQSFSSSRAILKPYASQERRVSCVT